MCPHAALEAPIPDRATAGKALARLLSAYRQRRDVLVLALPRGGVPIAYEIAMALDVRLDLMLVRKLGVPWQAELAMGAIASNGVQVLNEDVIASCHVSRAAIAAVVAQETHELLRRTHAYRGERPLPALRGQQLILVDDGVATGASMRAAIKAARQEKPARIVLAVPVAAADSVAQLQAEVDEIVCPLVPDMLAAIGYWYAAFPQVSDGEVRSLLGLAWQRPCEQGPTGEAD